jgi:hypothetical protein
MLLRETCNGNPTINRERHMTTSGFKVKACISFSHPTDKCRSWLEWFGFCFMYIIVWCVYSSSLPQCYDMGIRGLTCVYLEPPCVYTAYLYRREPRQSHNTAMASVDPRHFFRALWKLSELDTHHFWKISSLTLSSLWQCQLPALWKLITSISIIRLNKIVFLAPFSPQY